MASGELSSIIITDLLSCSPLCPLFRSCVFTFLCCLPPSQLHLAGLFLTYDLRHVLHLSSGSGSGFSCESCSAEVAFTSGVGCSAMPFVWVFSSKRKCSVCGLSRDSWLPLLYQYGLFELANFHDKSILCWNRWSKSCSHASQICSKKIESLLILAKVGQISNVIQTLSLLLAHHPYAISFFPGVGGTQ